MRDAVTRRRKNNVCPSLLTHILQSWARTPKLLRRLASVCLFQMVLRLASLRTFPEIVFAQ